MPGLNGQPISGMFGFMLHGLLYPLLMLFHSIAFFDQRPHLSLIAYCQALIRSLANSSFASISLSRI
jgi:hypothetical protein